MLVFTTKYMNFSRYYRGAFDPNIINMDVQKKSMNVNPVKDVLIKRNAVP